MTATVTATASPQRRWAGVRRLLAVRLDNLGDVLMTTPALVALRCAFPAAHIALLASGAGAVIGRRVPAVDEVIAFDAPWMQNGTGATTDIAPTARDGDPLPGRAERALIDMLAERRFDAAVIFTVCTQSALPAALLCRLAGVPLRLAHSRENPYALLSDWVRESDVVGDGMRHEVQRQLDLVAHVGCRAVDDRLVLHHDADDAVRPRKLLRGAGAAPPRRYVVVHVGATAESRRYPAASFGVAAALVAERSGALLVFTGQAGEAPLIEEARRALAERLSSSAAPPRHAASSAPTVSVSLAGELDLGELAALIAGAEVLITNNSGPMHIAAATQTPVVALYALTNPQHTPWRVPARVLSHDVPCRHCLRSVCPQGHHDCLRRIQPAAVAAAALELMRAARPADAERAPLCEAAP